MGAQDGGAWQSQLAANALQKKLQAFKPSATSIKEDQSGLATKIERPKRSPKVHEAPFLR